MFHSTAKESLCVVSVETKHLYMLCNLPHNQITMNYELNDLIKNADIVRFVNSKRMAWLGHVMWMEGKRIHKRVLEWKPTGRRNRGRSRKRWIEDIEEDIQIMGIRGWGKLCKERAEWKRITERAKNRQWVVTAVKEEEEFTPQQFDT